LFHIHSAHAVSMRYLYCCKPSTHIVVT